MHCSSAVARRRRFRPSEVLRCGGGNSRRRAGGYVLLETVIATGMLILGLAVLGTMVQDSDTAVHKLNIQVRARMLAEQFLSLMDAGQLELDSLDDIEEDDFGSRYPQWGWRLTTNETATDELFLLKIDILYHRPREDDEDRYPHEEAELIYTFYTFRTAPQELNLADSFGLREEEMLDLAEKLGGLGVDGLDPDAFDPSILARLEFEELIEVLPTLMDVMHLDVESLLGQLPADVRQALEDQGVLSELMGGEEGGGGDYMGDGP
jgi:type II secretory pathway pseudopilin PulG